MGTGTKSDFEPFIIAIIGLLAGALFWLSHAPFWQSLALFVNLYVLALYDWRSFRLPNSLTATLFLSGAVYLVTTPDLDVFHHIIGSTAGLLFFPTLNSIYKRLRGRDGIGMGDAKLLAGIGLWLGWQALPHVLLAASLTGLLYAGGRSVSMGKIASTTKLPFGVFLCFATWLIWLFLM